MEILGMYNYVVFAVLLMVGLYCILARTNIVKSIIGLSIFQSAVFLLYISMDKVDGGTAPIIQPGAPADAIYANPLPQVLILTAIVVGISTTALALAVAVRIKEAYGTIEEDKIQEMDREL
jgi:multicomponent Na+:H+ antiporter subunit C